MEELQEVIGSAINIFKCIVCIMYTYEPRDHGSNHKDLHRFKQDTITELRRGSEHKILPLIKKLFAIDTCLEIKIIFSPRELIFGVSDNLR